MGIKDWWNNFTNPEAIHCTLEVAATKSKQFSDYISDPERRYEYDKKWLLNSLGKFLNERKECTKYDLEQALDEFAHAAMAMENMADVEKSAAKSIVQDQYYLARSKIFALVFCTKDMSAEAVEAFIKGLENKDE